MSEKVPDTEEFRFQSVGEHLKSERLRQNLSLSDIATRTRVPTRHLEAIEKSDYSSLPGLTYIKGFTRSYAQALDIDAGKIVTELGAELTASGQDSHFAPKQNYQPADPARVPPKALAWTAAAVGLVLVLGYIAWRAYFMPGPEQIATQIDAAPTAKAGIAKMSTVAPALSPPTGEVVLTATDTVWVKIYDGDNISLYQNEMKAGDRYVVPADAKNPMIVTGRPQALDVTVGATKVPALGAADKTIVDIGVSAAALTARQNEIGAAPTSTEQAENTPE